MNRTEYNKLQIESKRNLRNGIKRFAEQNPERFAELQTQAKYELEHPPEPQIIRSTSKLDIDKTITQFRAGRKDYYVYTLDCFNDTHLYFETLLNEIDATRVLTERHPRFAERKERVTKVTKCQCPLCQ